MNSFTRYSIPGIIYTQLLASRLFDFLSASVVFGHKSQGKSQFLFFVFKLLQAMGEKVKYVVTHEV
jgi:hypothetical protein